MEINLWKCLYIFATIIKMRSEDLNHNLTVRRVCSSMYLLWKIVDTLYTDLSFYQEVMLI